MGRPQDDVDEVGERLEDLRQGLEHVLDALVGREQAEGEGHLPAVDAELVLVIRGVDERHVGDAVRDQGDLGSGDAVDLAQERRGALGHDDDAGGQAADGAGPAAGRRPAPRGRCAGS